MGISDARSVLSLKRLKSLEVMARHGTFMINFNFLQKGADPLFFSKIAESHQGGGSPP
jgi:hypothetical protein